MTEFERLLMSLPNNACQCALCKGYLDPRSDIHCPMEFSHGNSTIHIARAVLCNDCNRVTIGDMARVGIKVSLIDNVPEEEEIVDGGCITFSLSLNGDAVEDR